MTRRSLVSPEAPLTIAHRAGNDPALGRRARQAGVDLLEADIWLYRGRLEVRHLKTMGPIPLLWDRWELAPGWRSRQTLEELVDEAGDAELLLDLKGTAAGLPREVIAVMGAAGRPYSVCSQSWPLLEPFRELPGVRVFHSIGKRTALAAVLGRTLSPGAVSIHQKFLSPSVVKQLLPIVPVITTWPVNTLARATELRSWGVNGFTSDNLELLAQLVSEEHAAVPGPHVQSPMGRDM